MICGLGDGLEPLLEPMLAVLGRSWGLCWRSGAEKCKEHSYHENVCISRAGARSAAWRSVLSRSWGLCWRSWAALGAYVGGLGPLLELSLAFVGGPGPSWAEKCAKPEREGDLASGSEPKSGPNPSGKAFLGRELKWSVFCPPAARTHFFYRYSLVPSLHRHPC